MPEQQRDDRSDFDAMLRRELDVASAKAAKLDAEIADRQVERQELADRMHHLQALLGASGTTDKGASASGSFAPVETPEAADLVVAILSDAGSPLHFRDIYEEFVARGGSIGGKDPANNLLTKFYDDSRVRRIGRGTYEIADGSPPPAADRPRTPSPN